MLNGGEKLAGTKMRVKTGADFCILSVFWLLTSAFYSTCFESAISAFHDEAFEFEQEQRG